MWRRSRLFVVEEVRRVHGGLLVMRQGWRQRPVSISWCAMYRICSPPRALRALWIKKLWVDRFFDSRHPRITVDKWLSRNGAKLEEAGEEALGDGR